MADKTDFLTNAPAPWSYRRMGKHFAIEAANGVRVAEVGFIRRPDGSTSEELATAIVEAVNASATGMDAR